MKMYKTIRSMCEDLDLTKQAIYHRIKRWLVAFVNDGKGKAGYAVLKEAKPGYPKGKPRKTLQVVEVSPNRTNEREVCIP